MSTSFGGFLALHAAAARPERIERMVEFGWTLGAPMAGIPLSMRIASIPVLGGLMARLPANERIVRTIFKQLGLGPAMQDGRVSQTMVDAFRSILNDTDTMTNELKAGPRIVTMRGMNDSVLIPASVLAQIDTPIAFIWGADDPVGGADIARQFVTQLRNAELEIVTGGHVVWIDNPEHSANAVRQFLTGE